MMNLSMFSKVSLWFFTQISFEVEKQERSLPCHVRLVVQAYLSQAVGAPKLVFVGGFVNHFCQEALLLPKNPRLQCLKGC